MNKTQETIQHGGEKALLEQIAILQKQLDDCVPKPKEPKENYDKARYEAIVFDAADELIINSKTNDYTYFLQCMFREYVKSERFKRSKVEDVDLYTDLLNMLNKFEQAEALLLEKDQE